MTGDLPGGKWTPVLIGPWWPQAPTALHDGARHWQEMSTQQDHYGQDLAATGERLGRNTGVTADDLIGQFTAGNKFHINLAKKYETKSLAFNRAANAVDNLRSGLTSIADDYNKQIEAIEKKAQGSAAAMAVAVGEIEALITAANGEAASKSTAAVSTLTDAVQSILTAEGSNMTPTQFMQSQGIHEKEPKRPNAELAAKRGLDPGNKADSGLTHAEDAKEHGHTGLCSDPSKAGGEGLEGRHVSPAGGASGGHVPGGSGGHVPTSGAPVPSANAPGLGGLSPSSLGNAVSPSSLGQGFQSGLQAGQPAAASVQPLAGAAMPPAAAAPPPVQSPPVTPYTAPTIAANGGADAASSVGHSGSAGAAPAVSSGGGWSAAPPPTVMGAPVSGSSAPTPAVSSTPAGPLPAYGSDLRPMTAAPPPPLTPSVSAGSVGGAPAAGSPSSSPSSGGLVSPVDRSAPAAAAGAHADGSATSGSGLAAATAGAVAGDGAKRVAVQRDLQSKVYAVARQEPSIGWAAGLLDDDSTIVLTTDLAAGWVPPHVLLPAGVTLLMPSARRRDMSAVDLLGAVSVAAAHERHGYIPDSGAGDPVLSGERARYGHHVDELGPTLVDAIRRRSGLPRIAQTIAGAAVRRTGVLDSETDVLRAEIGGLRRDVIASYPQHDGGAVGDWMLLSAIDALVGGHQELAHYHLAWYIASFATTAGRHW